jgi:hypothetical protein
MYLPLQPVWRDHLLKRKPLSRVTCLGVKGLGKPEEKVLGHYTNKYTIKMAILTNKYHKKKLP